MILISFIIIILINAYRALLAFKIKLVELLIQLLNELPFHFFFVLSSKVSSLINVLYLCVNVAEVTCNNLSILFKIVVL
jgi:hypothetical protein